MEIYIIMKSKKIVLFLLFMVGFFAFYSHPKAVTDPYLAITSNQYEEGDKKDKDDTHSIGEGVSIQLYAVMQYGNDICIEEMECGIYILDGNVLDVTWESSNPEVVSITETGKITGVKAGNATITATHDEYTATYDIEVEESVITVGASIVITPSLIAPGHESLKVGSTDTFIASVIEMSIEEAENIVFSIEDESIAEIIDTSYDTEKGEAYVTIKYLAAGKTNIIASLTVDDKVYVDSYELDVKEFEGFLVISASGLDDIPASIKVGDKIQLEAILYTNAYGAIPLEYAVEHDTTWTSSDVNIATINNGLLEGIGKGEVTITVTYTILEGPEKDKTYTAIYRLNVTDGTSSDPVDGDGGGNTGTPVDGTGNVIINPPTGAALIITAWVIGIVSITYAFWHFRNFY